MQWWFDWYARQHRCCYRQLPALRPASIQALTIHHAESASRVGFIQVMGGAVVYFGIGLCLIIAGFSLLFGQHSHLPQGSKIPLNFGEYKDLAGLAFMVVGVVMLWLGRKSLRGSSNDDS